MSGRAMEMFAAIEGRVRGMVARAIVRLVDDDRKAQELQLELLADEGQDAVERFQNYGFTSVPHDGAEALVVFPAGLRSHGVALVCEDRRYRLKGLETGEVALFDDLGNSVKLGRDTVEITAVSACVVTAPEVEINCDIAQVTAGQVVLESDDIQLGGSGGPAVARVGDDVDPATNKIVTGSDKVTAA